MVQDSNRKRAFKLYRLGLRYYNTGHIKEAIHVLKEAARERPNSAKIWIALALAYLDIEDLKNFSYCFEKAYKINPQKVIDLALKGPTFKFWAEIGYEFCKNELYEMAIECLEMATINDPFNVAAYEKLALAYEKLEDYEMAYKCCACVIGFGIENNAILSLLRKIEKKLGNKIDDIKMDQDVILWMNNGRINFFLGDHDKAMLSFNRVLELDPNHKYARNYVNMLKSMKGVN